MKFKNGNFQIPEIMINMFPMPRMKQRLFMDLGIPYTTRMRDVMRGKCEPETDGRAGLRSLELLTAAYIAARDNSTVGLTMKPVEKLMSKIYINDTAIVDDGAVLDEGTRVWHWVHKVSGAEIGKNVSLGQNVFVASKVKIGDGCKIQNNVSVYDNVILKRMSFVALVWFLQMYIIQGLLLIVKMSFEKRASWGWGNIGSELQSFVEIKLANSRSLALAL